MPVTFAVANHDAEEINTNDLRYRDSRWGGDDNKSAKRELVTEQTGDKNQTTVQHFNGFVHAVVSAYNYHHNLVLRPDDVWLAIMVQFNAHVNANADKLRRLFVKHADKKQLTVYGKGCLQTANYPELCQKMSDTIQENLISGDVAKWVEPKFSTTTPVDVTASHIVLMSSLQSYFAYKFYLMCGIPQVTLNGTVDDWKEIESRASKLVEYDVAGEMKHWYSLLQPVLANFTQSASGNPNVQWWNRVCDKIGGGSGPRYLSGWITVFCVFDDRGKWVGNNIGRKIEDFVPSAEKWPVLNTNDIPSGSCSVPLIVDDNGKEYKCELQAGHTDIVCVDKFTVTPNVKWSLYVIS